MVLTRRSAPKAAAETEIPGQIPWYRFLPPQSSFFDPIAAALVSRRNIGDGQFGAGGRRIANWYVNLPALLVGLVLVVRGAISPALLHIGLTTFLVTEVPSSLTTFLAHHLPRHHQVEWRSNFCVLIGSCQRRSVVPAIGIVVVAMLASATLLGALALAMDCPIDDAFLALLDPRVLLNTPRFFSSSWQCTPRVDPWVRS